LEVLTSTDRTQAWGTLKENALKQFEPIPLKDFCHVSNQHQPYRRPNIEITQEMQEEFISMYLQGNFLNSVIFRLNLPKSK